MNALVSQGRTDEVESLAAEFRTEAYRGAALHPEDRWWLLRVVDAEAATGRLRRVRGDHEGSLGAWRAARWISGLLAADGTADVSSSLLVATCDEELAQLALDSGRLDDATSGGETS